MSFEKNYYRQYAKNIFTQNGDDGIIEKIFEHLKITNGIVVEFGAWDGIYLSNVYNLWRYKNFNAILIESDSIKANELLNLVDGYDNVECMNCLVSPYKDDDYSLDNLLKMSEFHIDNDTFALVSIDVDSCDYHIFESLQDFSPKVVIIETKTFPDHVDIFYDYAQFGSGCSLYSVTKLANLKGYTLVCHNGNAYFIRNDLVSFLPTEADFSYKNLYCSDQDVDKWQSLDSYGNENPNSRYYMTKEYTNLIESEMKKCKML